MSQENVEVVRRVYDAWNAGDMTALRDLCDLDVVMHHREGWPEAGPSVGREAVMRQCEQLRDAGRATRWSRSLTSSPPPTT
jgi:ketosteroid isomerase-like protein